MLSSAPKTNHLTPQTIVAAVRDVLGGVERAALHEPEFRGAEIAYVTDCIETGWVSSVGSYVDRFEQMLAELAGVERAVATVNGTAALHIGLLLAGVEPGDEVLMPTLTFIATANAVSYAGATPHFVDSEPVTLGIDVPALDAYLGDIAEVRDDVCVNRKTGAVIRAVVPMHVFGHPTDMVALAALADRWRITVVEDAAESLGSTLGGKPCGSFGKVAALSFNGNKVVTTGGGGAILTNDPEIGRLAKHLTTTARVAHRWSFIHDRIGYNYRMPNINAALGCAQLERLDDMLSRKRTLAARYIARFADVAGADIVAEPAGSQSNYWLMAMMMDEPDEALRDAVLEALNDQGYGARPVWTLMHRLPMFAACPSMPVEGALALEKRLINLPSSPRLAETGR